MHVDAAYDRQDVQLARAHAVQGHVERVVGMDMREFAGIEYLTQPFGSQAVVVATLQVLQANDPYDSALIAHRPGLKFAGAEFLQRYLDGHPRAQSSCSIAHR